MHMSKLDFNSEDEKALVTTVYDNALESLSEEDRALPQVVSILPLIKRGVGIHHGGLLPILKEVLEILFQEGLIKCLFATDTFSIGINMPAKTVVFTSTRKFDGDDFRWISSGEYVYEAFLSFCIALALALALAFLPPLFLSLSLSLFI